MKKILLFVLCLATAGCATAAKYETKLNTWIGASEDSLIASWGVPDKTYNLSEGKKALQFVRKDIFETGGYTYTMPETTYHAGTVGDKQYSGISTTYVRETEPVRKHKLYCATSFVIDSNGRVESWHHEGNNCVSK
jgi:hypothetical protein